MGCDLVKFKVQSHEIPDVIKSQQISNETNVSESTPTTLLT